jgi:NADP-dependent 3-hydroxy acid dehydrogenase YdfG
MRKTWFVTGAASRLGADIVNAALAQGDCVFATDGDAAALGTGLARPDDHRLVVLPLDVADGRAVAAAVHAAVERFGRLDVVVHGEPLRQGGGTLGRWPDSDFVRGLFNVTRGALPAMRAQHAGRIHHLVPPTRPGTGPGGSLFSIAGFCAAVAADVAADGIAVTAVEPAEAHARIFAEWAMGDDELLEEA